MELEATLLPWVAGALSARSRCPGPCLVDVGRGAKHIILGS